MSTDDYTLANALLIGFIGTDEKGLPIQKYLDDESEARRAIARLLRRPGALEHGRLGRQLIECLATLFEPEPTDGLGGERQLVFKFRRRGNRRDALRNSVIFSHVLAGIEEKGLSVEKAIYATAEEFELSYDAVMNIWSEFRDYRRWLEAGAPTAPEVK